jgi:hypothetical protein
MFRSLIASRASSLAVDAAHTEVFDFEEFLDAVFRAFAADAAFLHPAEGAIISVEMMPSLMPTMPYSGLGDAPDAADVATVE